MLGTQTWGQWGEGHRGLTLTGPRLSPLAGHTHPLEPRLRAASFPKQVSLPESLGQERAGPKVLPEPRFLLNSINAPQGSAALAPGCGLLV